MRDKKPATETDRIRLQLQHAFERNAWHGPSVLEIISNVEAEQALAKPVGGVHSIWEIILHLTATQEILLRRLDGDASAINLPETSEWPSVSETNEAAFRDAVSKLTQGDIALRERIMAFPADQLDAPLIPGGSSAYINFHGYVQHNIYHAAQIRLLSRIQNREARGATCPAPRSVKDGG